MVQIEPAQIQRVIARCVRSAGPDRLAWRHGGGDRPPRVRAPEVRPHTRKRRAPVPVRPFAGPLVVGRGRVARGQRRARGRCARLWQDAGHRCPGAPAVAIAAPAMLQVDPGDGARQAQAARPGPVPPSSRSAPPVIQRGCNPMPSRIAPSSTGTSLRRIGRERSARRRLDRGVTADSRCYRRSRHPRPLGPASIVGEFSRCRAREVDRLLLVLVGKTGGGGTRAWHHDVLQIVHTWR